MTRRSGDRRAADARRAAGGAGGRAATGRPGADHGLAPRRSPFAVPAGPRGVEPRRSSRSSSTRASSTTPDDFGRYPRNEARDVAICTEEGVDLVWAPPVEEVYPPGLRHDRLGRRASASRWRAPPGRATSTGSPRSSPSCSLSSARSGRTSGRRTPSRSRSSTGWPATWPCRPRSSPAPPCASRMAWRCRHGTCTSPPRNGPPRRCSTARSWPPATAGTPASARPRRCARRSASRRRRAAGRASNTSAWPTPLTLAELDQVDGSGAAVAGGPVRIDPAHRQRAARLGSQLSPRRSKVSAERSLASAAERSEGPRARRSRPMSAEPRTGGADRTRTRAAGATAAMPDRIRA